MYGFELKVTNYEGLFSKDTMLVIVYDPSQPNQPPVADAGSDLTLFLPVNNVTLSGHASMDPDGYVLSYLWMKISGPDQSAIVYSSAASTGVTGLTEGTYQFRLEVIDNLGAIDDDTVAVTVNRPYSIPIINTQLIWVGKLSGGRVATAAATAGIKMLFAGGVTIENHNQITGIFPTVDIYDYTSNIWSTAPESGKADIVSWQQALVIKFFLPEVGFPMGSEKRRRVDIYDVVTNGWSYRRTTDSRIYGKTSCWFWNKIFFAGGRIPWKSLVL